MQSSDERTESGAAIVVAETALRANHPITVRRWTVHWNGRNLRHGNVLARKGEAVLLLAPALRGRLGEGIFPNPCELTNSEDTSKESITLNAENVSSGRISRNPLTLALSPQCRGEGTRGDTGNASGTHRYRSRKGFYATRRFCQDDDNFPAVHSRAGQRLLV